MEKQDIKILITISILSIGIGWYLFQQLSGLCGNDIISEITSPNGQYKTVIFQRDCGATTGFSTQVSILKSDQSLNNESGNIFTSYTNDGAAPSGPGGGPKVTASWLDESTLNITHHPDARVNKYKSNFEGIKIVYAEDNDY